MPLPVKAAHELFDHLVFSKVRDVFGGRVRFMISGSAPLSAQTFGEFEQLFGQRILERYGMTETVMNLTNPYDGERRPGTVGMPFPGQEARIVDLAKSSQDPFYDYENKVFAGGTLSGNSLTSAITDPPLLRIVSMSTSFVESNTSQTVSARRNNAADVAVAKENVRSRPSLLRLASTVLSLAPITGGDLVSAGGSDAARVVFGGISFAGTSAAGAAVNGCAGIGVSGTSGIFGATSGLTPILACCAKVSGVSGAVSPDCRDAAASSAGFSDTAGAVAIGAADAGAADTLACGASAAGDDNADCFSGCWKATSTM